MWFIRQVSSFQFSIFITSKEMNSIKESPNVPEQIAKKTLNEFKQAWIETFYQDNLST